MPSYFDTGETPRRRTPYFAAPGGGVGFPPVADPTYGPGDLAPSAVQRQALPSPAAPVAAVPPPATAAAPPQAQPGMFETGRTYYDMPGWMTGKLNDPTVDTSPKYQFGRFIQNTGSAPTAESLSRFVSENPQWETQAGTDLLRMKGAPQWEDVVKDFGGENPQWNWLDVPAAGTPRAAAMGVGGGTIPGLGGGVPGLPGTNGAGTSGLPGVGGGDLSGVLDNALQNLILNQGKTDFGGGVQNALSELIGRGGVTPDTQQQLIKAREQAFESEQSQLADARGELADRGLLSTPGVPQGPEGSTIQRIAEKIAPTYSQATGDVFSHAVDVSNQSLMSSLSLATGMSNDQANNILQAVGTGTQRQQALANISLNILAQNADWNKFIAQYGLDRAKLDDDIQNNRLDRVIQLLQVFLGGAQIGAGGYIR